MHRNFAPFSRRAICTLIGLAALFTIPSSPSAAKPLERFRLQLSQAFARFAELPWSASAVPAPAPAQREPLASRPPRARLVRDRYFDSIPYGAEMRRAARRSGVDGLLIASVVEIESSFQADAVSPKGARGLMQLMPPLTRGLREPLDPEANLQAGARYLRSLADGYDGRIESALAAYYAGPDGVDSSSMEPRRGAARRYVTEVLARYAQHRTALAEAIASAERAAAALEDRGELQRGS